MQYNAQLIGQKPNYIIIYSKSAIYCTINRKTYQMSLKRHHHSKITLHQEAVIFNDYLQNGRTLKSYSEEYNTSINTIKRVIEEGLNKLKKWVS